MIMIKKIIKCIASWNGNFQIVLLCRYNSNSNCSKRLTNSAFPGQSVSCRIKQKTLQLFRIRIVTIKLGNLEKKSMEMFTLGKKNPDYRQTTFYNQTKVLLFFFVLEFSTWNLLYKEIRYKYNIVDAKYNPVTQ